MKDVNIITLTGETLTRIEQKEGEVIEFETQSGRKFQMYHDQDCCESVRVHDVTGSLQDLIGSKILLVKEDISTDWPSDVEKPKYENESFAWTTFEFRTASSVVVIRWHGESNGYYSESVSFGEIDK